MDHPSVPTDRVRNLGVTIDSYLTWVHHVKLIEDRCFGILIGLNHPKHLLPTELLPQIIDALVWPDMFLGNRDPTHFAFVRNL